MRKNQLLRFQISKHLRNIFVNFKINRCYKGWTNYDSNPEKIVTRFSSLHKSCHINKRNLKHYEKQKYWIENSENYSQ